MVGSMTLLKMLHCRLKRKKSSGVLDEDALQGSSDGKFSVKIKQEHQNENICRICLSKGSIPIYGNGEVEDMSRDINTFAGIEVRSDDTYPKNVCKSCHALLQGAILFRKTAQESDHYLKQTSQELNEDSDNKDDFINNDGDDINYDYQLDKVDTDDIAFDCKVEKVECKEEKEKQKTYGCKKCNLEFETFKEYEDHRISDEHENKKLSCPICNQMYVPAYLKKHIKLHKLETTYMCDICGKKFVIQGQFTRHRLTHFYDLPFKCSLCPYRGRFSESLKMHMRTHTGEKPYQCPQCPTRFFVNKSNLNKHMLIHKGDHDFRCSVCQRGFYTKRELDLHFKVDHSGIKDHACDICGKVFGYRKQMMKHQLKVHKRQKLRSGRTPLYMIADKKQIEN